MENWRNLDPFVVNLNIFNCKNNTDSLKKLQNWKDLKKKGKITQNLISDKSSL